MLVHGLRLLVALITFGFGVAATSLLSFERAVKFRKPVKSCRAVLVARTASEPPAPASMSGAFDWGSPEGADVEGGVLNGKAVSKPAPEWPHVAGAEGLRGTVFVRVVVNERGDVASARALSGLPALQPAAVAAARKARFAPTLLSGRPLKVAGVLSYNFDMD
ncbi:MAG TPA: TonB family protein [Pyrinomonadaceae bacterium]|jgi:TonB family protein